MKGLQFRLYTERIDTDRITNYAEAKGLKNFTCYHAVGKYNGINEYTFILEYITSINLLTDLDKIRRIFRDISNRIKKFNKQETVLLTEQPIEFELY